MNESQVFANALKLADHAARAAYLDSVCAGNPRLRADVEALLQAHASNAEFLERPPATPGATIDEPSASGPQGVLMSPRPGDAERVGAVLAGRYKLLELIGEGGMGAVWMAQQTEPVKRLVAVKLIKAGMDSRTVLARFGAERQALAMMDHPHIAKVLDAGSAPDGRPFFVMELVKGVPITKFCDDRKLTPRQRLELFMPVCHAIQHAHHKGVIHRDVKPSNVLVALYDDKPVPKVIDFGVAKATGQALTEQTLHTGFGAVVGTVEYMSPEQATFNQLDVDTRSDIYSLGVLLYELLTGGPPFSRKELEKAGMLEVLRVIREQEPSKPSAKLSTADGLAALAAKRGTEPKRLAALMRGELDWIVMKALEKDRSRRYETANGFAMDLQRYLADEPVLAGPPSAAYRLRKFLRRHKGRAAAVIGMAGLLLLGVLATLVTGLIYDQYLRYALSDVAAQKRAVVDARTDADGLREDARKIKETADGLRADARKANDAAGQRLARSATTAAFREWERNDGGAALLLLAEAVRADATDSDRAYVHRTRFRQFLKNQPRLVRMWFPGRNPSAAFSPDGDRVLIWDEDGTAQVGDLATGNAVGQPMRHRGSVTSAQFSRDGKRVLTLTSVQLVNDPERLPGFAASLIGLTAASPLTGLLTQQPIREGEHGYAYDTQFDRAEARVWDAATGIPLTPPLRHEDDRLTTVFTPDGSRLVAVASPRYGSYGGLRIWDAADGRLLADMPKLFEDCSAVTASPDGGRLALFRAGEVRFWDVATEKFVGPAIPVPDNFVNPIFGPAGDRIAWCRLPREGKPLLEAWNVATGQALFAPIEVDRSPDQILWSPDGRRIAAALQPRENSTAGLLRAWDAATGKPIGDPWSHPDSITPIAFTPDGNRVIATASLPGGQGSTMYIWTVGEQGPPSVQFLGLAGAVAVHPNGRLLLNIDPGSDSELGAVSLWDLAIDEPVVRCADARRNVQWGTYYAFAQLSADGRRLLTSTRGERPSLTTLWDTATGRPVGSPILQNMEAPLASPDGRTFLTWPFTQDGHKDGLRVWDAADGHLIRELRLDAVHVSDAAFTPDGRRVLISDQKEKVGWWDPATGETNFLPLQLAMVKWHSVLFSPRGDRILVLVGGNAGRLWDVTTGQPIGSTLKNGRVMLFSPDGRRLLLGGAGAVQLWDAASGAPIAAPLPHVDEINPPVFSADCRNVLTRCDAGHVCVWNAADGQPLGPPLSQDHESWQAEFSPDSRSVLTSSRNGTVRVYDLAGRPLTPPLPHVAESTAVLAGGGRDPAMCAKPRISPDGRVLLTTTANNYAIAFWDLQTGKQIRPPQTRRLLLATNQFVTDPPSAIDFTPDGRWILVDDETNFAPGEVTTIWDAATCAPIMPGPMSFGGVSFSPDGRLSINGVGSSKVEVRELTPDERPADDLVRLAQLLTGRRLDEGLLNFTSLDVAERRQLWEDLRARCPDQFVLPTVGQMLTWHRGAVKESGYDAGEQIWHLDQLIALEPQNGMHYANRAEARAQRQEWDAAEADLHKAVELNADGPETWNKLALLRVRAGDTAGYRRAYDQLAQRHPDYASGRNDRAIPTAVLAPCEGLDLMPLLHHEEQLGKMAEATNTCVGLYQYRLGRYADAVQSLTTGLKDDKDCSRPWDWFFLAMAHHRAGNPAEAKQCYDKAAAKLAQDESDYPRNKLWDILTEQLLKAEADKVLGMDPR